MIFLGGFCVKEGFFSLCETMIIGKMVQILNCVFLATGNIVHELTDKI